jgi:acyl CoA:acetate/3-ketoacid CoA transferase alpha subunit
MAVEAAQIGLETMLAVGGVSGVGGALGSVIGNRVNVEWIKKVLADHAGQLSEHGRFIQAHELEIELIKRGKHP